MGNIASVETSHYVAAGLKDDETVLFAGKPAWGAFSTQEWTNIQKLYGGDYYLVGLKEDGNLVLAGKDSINQEIIKSWDNIVDVSINNNCILGLKRDGTVVAAMNSTSSAAAVREWKGLKVMTDLIDYSNDCFISLGIMTNEQKRDVEARAMDAAMNQSKDEYDTLSFSQTDSLYRMKGV